MKIILSMTIWSNDMKWFFQIGGHSPNWRMHQHVLHISPNDESKVLSLWTQIVHFNKSIFTFLPSDREYPLSIPAMYRTHARYPVKSPWGTNLKIDQLGLNVKTKQKLSWRSLHPALGLAPTFLGWDGLSD